jgi:adenylyl- and sulfurtransferase ThiI
MKFIIKLHPEIVIKSKSVRKRFTRLLEGNIRLVFKRNQLSRLDRGQFYYLYCVKGVMSQLQALLLREQGYKNVHVYRP